MYTLDFIKMVLNGAIEVQIETGIFASVTIAQSIWETGAGASTPKDINTGEESFNLFGRKAVNGEPFVMAKTWEVVNGVRINIVAPFKKFTCYEESVLDRSSFLKLKYYTKACSAKNAIDACSFLIHTGYFDAYHQEIGYATDPNYSNGIISVINSYNLTQYDSEANIMLDKINARLDAIETKITVLDKISPPNWFTAEFGTHALDGIVTDMTGDVNFWRETAITLREFKAKHL